MKPTPYIIMGALATGLWVCPSCDSRSDRSVVDDFDHKAATAPAPTNPDDKTVPRAGSNFIDRSDRPTGPTVSERPWVEDGKTYREPGETDPMKARFRESSDRRADELDDRMKADREQLERDRKLGGDRTFEGSKPIEGDAARQRDTSERMQDTSGPFAKQLPEFSLVDPKGTSYTRSTISTEGVVFVVTAPTIASKSAQEGWTKTLAEARGQSKGKVVFLEDMSQSAFKETARSEMGKDYDPSTGPVILIDEAGSVRQQLQVAEDKTVVLVYDSNGKLLHSEQGDPSPQRAKMVWEKLGGKK